MPRHLFNIAATLCAATVGFVISIWLISNSVDLSKHVADVSANFHLSVYGQGFGTRLEIFNDAKNGPNEGAMVSVSGPHRPASDPADSGFGKSAGVYYRMIRWRSGVRWWTLSLNLVDLLLLIAIPLPAWWIIDRARRCQRGFAVIHGGH